MTTDLLVLKKLMHALHNRTICFYMLFTVAAAAGGRSRLVQRA